MDLREREISATEFKKDCLRWVSEVERTRVPIRVTRRGKVVARLVPPSDEPLQTLLGSVSYENEVDLLGSVDEAWEADS